MESYGKFIFRDKEAQKNWDEASDSVKDAVSWILAENIAEMERKLLYEYKKAKVYVRFK